MFKKLPYRILKKLGLEIVKLNKHKDDEQDLTRLIQKHLNNEPIKLHFGCGPRVLKDWANIDLAFEPYENYLQYYTDKHYPENIRGGKSDFYKINIIQTGLPLPDESVELIFHEDFFEHLTQKEQVVFLAETFRVLKKGAVHRINTPNLLASMRDNSIFKNGKNGVYVGEWDNWHHHNVITPAILQEMAKMIGYSEIMFNSKNNSIAARLLPIEYRPDEKDRPAADSNVFADLIK